MFKAGWIKVRGIVSEALSVCRGCGSGGDAIAPRIIAASATVFVIGPAVSWLLEIGMIPCVLTNPTVGFMPTRLFIADGLTIEPSVSVPIAPAHRPAATAAPDPEQAPPGERSSA